METLSKINFENWLTSRKLTPVTIEDYIFYFKRINFTTINQEAINNFFSNPSNNNGVCRAFIKSLKRYLIQNKDELKITKEELSDIKEIEAPEVSGHKKKKLIKFFTYEEMLDLERHMKTERDKLMVLIIFYAGLRLGEFMQIRVKDFNWNKWKADMTKVGELKVSYHTKTGEGIAYLPPEVMKRLMDWINSFYFDEKCKQLNDWEMELPLFYPPNKRTWQQKFEDATKNLFGERKNMHALRHGFATHLFTQGVDIRLIKDLMRHSSTSSTEIYTHISQKLVEQKYSDVFNKGR